VNLFIVFVGIVHLLVSTALVVFILLHSGKGTGVSSMLGGVMTQAGASASLIERNLDRITIVLALVFLCTSLILAYGYRPITLNTGAGSVPVQAPGSTTTTP
jgi:preprotein translocase subunit SecG